MAARPASAQSVHDAQLWTQVVVTPTVATDWKLHLEVQPRWSEDVSALDQVIVRTAVGRAVSDGVTIWGGYAWIPRTLGPGTEYEQRAWQQLSATFPALGRWAPSLRVRLEQRFLDAWADSSHRLRMMGRTVRPLDDGKQWSVVGWNELMVTFDDTESGPWRGVDQNRLFGGVMRQLTRDATLEGGYLWQTLEPPGERREHNHIVMVLLTVVM